MTKYEEIYLLSSIQIKAKEGRSVELNNIEDWHTLLLSDKTYISDDYLFQLNEKGILNYDEIGEDGFKPIIICSITDKTNEYLRQLIIDVENNFYKEQEEIEKLNNRIIELLSFNPQKLSVEIKSTENEISKVKDQITNNPVLQTLIPHLNQIEIHFRSLSKVADHYEEIYKNILLPVTEEGRSGVRQTVKWAIISIITSTMLSVLFSWLLK